MAEKDSHRLSCRRHRHHNRGSNHLGARPRSGSEACESGTLRPSREAEKLLSDSVEEARRQAAVSPLLARSLADLAEVYRTEGKYSQAQAAYEEALQLCTKRGVRNRCR
jgi:hypothetical protein